jgi:uncharacterized membrane protein YdbT with pleckstrin-like domain
MAAVALYEDLTYQNPSNFIVVVVVVVVVVLCVPCAWMMHFVTLLLCCNDAYGKYGLRALRSYRRSIQLSCVSFVLTKLKVSRSRLLQQWEVSSCRQLL